MSAVPKPRYTVEEYLARERVAPSKSEYYRGEIFAMAGGSVRHNTISVNLVVSLRDRLRGSPCRPCNSDQRIRIPANGLSTYPDVSVVCGEVQTDTVDHDAIVNPRVIFEVLSNSTESYDRGKKFELYRTLPSLAEMVLVSQKEPLIEHFGRQDDGTWVLRERRAGQQVVLPSLGCQLSVDEVYLSVFETPTA